MKSNRTVATSLQGKQRGDFKRIESLPIENNDTLIVWLREVDFPVKLLKKVFTNESGQTGILYLVTNDLNLESTDFYQLYHKRWCIEEYHKSIKQNASLTKSPTRVIVSQCNHIFSSLIPYCNLEKLKIKSKLNHFAIKYKLLVRANQVPFQELKDFYASA